MDENSRTKLLLKKIKFLDPVKKGSKGKHGAREKIKRQTNKQTNKQQQQHKKRESLKDAVYL